MENNQIKIPKYRILWVDDEIELLKPYILYIEEKGYEVIPVCSGQDAISVCRKEKTDIVFLDENMPGMSGLDTLQSIKEYCPQVPVVMITKSEEENIMEQAIGEQIADYLIKPVNPSQIFLCLKKHLHTKDIISVHTNKSYQDEFSDLSFTIDQATTLQEWMAIYRTLTKWDISLKDIHSSMYEMLCSQKLQANSSFAKYIIKNYSMWFTNTGSVNGEIENCPPLSPNMFKNEIFPYTDNGEKVFFVVVDNFRYDQWKTIQPLLSEMFTLKEDKMYVSILPTTTQYARNAIFSGLMPLQIKKMFPDFWIDEIDEENKNIYENELIQSQLDRYRKKYGFSFFKINEITFCKKIIKQIKDMDTNLNIAVLNFIDMLSHSRTDSKMMRELCNDEAAYRSLTLSWFKHSATYDFFQEIAKNGYKLILTTDHGTIRIQNAIQIIADRETNTNLRYKVGKALVCKNKSAYEVTQPEKIGLPSPNVSSSYIFCTANDFFSYPNNFNYYAQFYKDSFQHGGISLEEMLIPLIIMDPK